MRRTVFIFLLACSVALGAQTTRPYKRPTPRPAPRPVPSAAQSLPPGSFAAVQAVNAGHIRADVKFLAGDLLEGRGTGTRGGQLAAEYIAAQFAIAGLQPAGDNGTYFQQLPLVGITTQPQTTFQVISPAGEARALRMMDDYVAIDESRQQQSDLDSELVFVGYGITAPEFGWNDYANVDVRGKILLMLVNEPLSELPPTLVSSSAAPSLGVLALELKHRFAGRDLTYYGRWTYKFEQAARLGAAGVILIHQTDLATYDWNVVRDSWTGERSYLRDDPPRLKLAAWLQFGAARQILSAAGKDFGALFAAANQPGFQPVPFSVRVKVHMVSKVRSFGAPNVIGLIRGSDPELRNQAVIFNAHYDHLGIHPQQSGDNIYDGALDNASGTAMVLDIARAIAASPIKPSRSLLFACVTAEEQGLLGSAYLANHLPLPVGHLQLAVNFDSVAPLGLPKEVSAPGYERTTFAPVFDKTAAEFGLRVIPDVRPQSGSYYRSDQFSFARGGVPTFSLDAGLKFEGHPESWIQQRSAEFTRNYHQPGDKFNPDDDYRCNAVISRFAIALAYRAADMPKLLQWVPGDEFEKRRQLSTRP
ncbi:MAG: M28 family peptidase [Candidatus Korobacteraceae bacterium]